MDRRALCVTSAETSATFTVKATDSKYRLDRLNVWANGVPIHGRNGLSLRDVPSQTASRDVRVELVPGPNLIEVSATNEKGAESLKESFSVQCTAPTTKPDLYLVAVGVSKYRDARYALTYAAKDASDLAACFENGKSTFAAVHVRRLLDGDATRDNILAAKTFLAGSKVGDTALVSVAGHGLLDKQLDYYFGTADLDFDHPADRGLPYEAIEDLLDGIPARNRLLLMDTCHAGEVDRDEATATAPRQVAGGAVTGRGPRAKLAGYIERPPSRNSDLLQSLFEDVRRGSGALVVAAAGGLEYSYEGAVWNNGVFTYSVLKGLRDGVADANHDGVITVTELRDYVAAQVADLTHGRQQPVARRENPRVDFAVGHTSASAQAEH